MISEGTPKQCSASFGGKGVAHLGFFVRESDGDVRYMETNGRLWASTAGSVAAGWEFPTWAYEYFVLGKAPTPPPEALGRLSRWHYGDLEALIGSLRGGDDSGGPARTRTRAVADYLSGFHPRVDSDMFTLDDPLPELLVHYHGIRGHASRALRKIAR